MTCAPPLSDILDAILLDMAVPHPHLSEAEEAALKARLLAIVTESDGWKGDPEQIARLFRDAKTER